jgi:hypothetical protein
VDDSAIGPSNQADLPGRDTISKANYSAEIVNSERLEEYRIPIGGRDVCFRGKEFERASSLGLCLCRKRQQK